MEFERDKELLTDLLNSEAWNAFLVKHLQKFKESDTLQVTMLRKPDTSPPDDYLRGRIDVYNFLLLGLPNQLTQWNNPEAENTSREIEGGQPGLGDPYSEPTSQEEE
jgi:hypothetical protein